MRKTRTEKVLVAALLVLVLLMVLVLVAGIGMAAWMLNEGRGPGYDGMVPVAEQQEATPVSVQAPYPKRHYAPEYDGMVPVAWTRRF